MNYYFYQDKGNRKGPYTYEELKAKRLLASTLVWTKGMDDWMQAKLVDGLEDIVIAEPPPVLVKIKSDKTTIQKSTANEKNEENEDQMLLSLIYDPTDKKENGAVFIGVGLILLSLMVSIEVHRTSDYDVRAAVNALFVLARIPLSIYVVQIAGRLNRNQIVWGIFGFFLPTFTLIVIGLLKKKMLKNIDLSNYITKWQRVEYCMEKAKKNFKKNRYTDSLIYLNKLLGLDSSYNEGRLLRGKACLELNLYQKAKFDFEQLKESNKYSAEAFYYLGEIEIINFNREQAIKNWFSAKKLGYDQAEKKLDLYHNFTGVYMLNINDRSRKLINKRLNPVICCFDVDYLSGFKEIDEKDNYNYSVTNIYDNGLEIKIKIKLQKEEQSINYAIAFYEIAEIKDDMGKLLIIKLFDGKLLTFKLKNEFRAIDELLILSNLYKAATGNNIA